ncbi:Arc family DNA-binding protein [Endozoicomonas montiporae]|uniref:Arc-like DNA binding domain-containing protein n=1 Tax=Endozoicomonas montiporae CL-33 TaxID=570277 RepID=A0A142BCU5_9GAMM|nr:Arc family DNA-binding protein [Endozoicomonas montiporae]AMO56571.1 hypothetical protein EZMO1_2487 [Endozoicomonas montiporae CL-33]
MSRSWPVYSLRVPEEVHEKISKAARQNKRSINSEYLHRVESSLEQESTLAQVLVELQRLSEKIDALEGKKPD